MTIGPAAALTLHRIESVSAWRTRASPPEPRNSNQSSRLRAYAKQNTAIILLFLLAAGVRAIDVWRPIDGTIREAWREADTCAIARNFYR